MGFICILHARRVGPGSEIPSFKGSLKISRACESFNSKGCMVEVGCKDTGFLIETLGPSHDTSTFISF